MAASATATDQEQFPDFSTATNFANFKLVVDGKTIFINAHALAEMSPVFAVMCFNEFKEKQEQAAYIGEEKHEDVLEMLRCLLPCSVINKKQKPITAVNFSLLLRLSDKYQIDILRAFCQNYIAENFEREAKADGEILIGMLQSAVEYRLDEKHLATIVKRVSSVADEILEASALIATIPGNLVRDIYVQKRENEKNNVRESKMHSFRCGTIGTTDGCKSFCYTCQNVRAIPSLHCRKCRLVFCREHMKTECSVVN